MVAGWSQVTARTIGVQKIVPFSQPPFLRNGGFLRVARHRRTDFPRRGAPRGADRHRHDRGYDPPARRPSGRRIAHYIRRQSRAIARLARIPHPRARRPSGRRSPLKIQMIERTKAGRAPTGRAPKPCLLLRNVDTNIIFAKNIFQDTCYVQV